MRLAWYEPMGRADFMKKSGVSYCGIVVTGPVSEVRRLLARSDASRATLGFVVEPRE